MLQVIASCSNNLAIKKQYKATSLLYIGNKLATQRGEAPNPPLRWSGTFKNKNSKKGGYFAGKTKNCIRKQRKKLF